MDRQKAEIERYERYRDDSIRALTKLDRPTIAHLLRAMEPSQIDGYPSGTPESSIHSRNDISRPTELAVINRLENTRTDPLLEAATDVLTRLAELSGHAKVISKRTDVVIHAGDSLKGRISSISNCQACNRDVAGTPADPIVSGYCRACRKDWERSGYMDRVAFEMKRRNEATTSVESA